MPDDAQRAARAEARRATMTIRKTTLEEDSDDNMVRGEAAMALTARLSLAAWSLATRGGPSASAPRSVVVRFVPWPAS